MAKDDVPKYEDTHPAYDETTPLDQPSSDKPTMANAVARGAGSGVTFGSQPVLAGAGAAALQAVSPLTGVDMGSKHGANLEALMSAYKEMQKEQMQKNQAAQAAHPVAYGASQIAGSIPTAVALGSAGVGAGAQGALMGEGSYLGNTDDPTLKGAATSAAGGALLGKGAEAVAPAVMGAAKKVLAPVGNLASKLVPNAMKVGFQDAAEGQTLPLVQTQAFKGSAQGRNLATQTAQTADSMTSRMMNVKNSLGQDIGNSIKAASEQGKTINLDKELQEFNQQIDDGVEANRIKPEEADQMKKSINDLLYKEEPQEAQQMGTIKETQNYSPDDEGDMGLNQTKRTLKLKGAAPEELQNMQSVDDAIPEDAEHADQTGQLSDTTGQEGDLSGRTVQTSSKLMSPATEGVTRGDLPISRVYQAKTDMEDLASQLWDTPGSSNAAKQVVSNLKNTLNNKLSEAVPDFGQKLQLYNKFLEYLPETIIAKGENPSMAGVRMGSMRNPELKVKQATEDLLSNLSKSGTGSKDAQETMGKLTQSLDNLSTIDNAAKAAAEIEGKPYQSIYSRLGLNKDEILSYIQSQSNKANIHDQYMNTGGVDLSWDPVKTLKSLGSERNQAVVGNLAGRFVGSRLYSAGNDVLAGVASKLAQDPSTKNLGEALNNAVTKGDTVARNAAIFAAMQNPRARAILDPDLKDELKEQNQPGSKSKYSF